MSHSDFDTVCLTNGRISYDKDRADENGSVGDAALIAPPTPPGALRRAVSAAGKAATRQAPRLLETTVLRERG